MIVTFSNIICIRQSWCETKPSIDHWLKHNFIQVFHCVGFWRKHCSLYLSMKNKSTDSKSFLASNFERLKRVYFILLSLILKSIFIPSAVGSVSNLVWWATLWFPLVQLFIWEIPFPIHAFSVSVQISLGGRVARKFHWNLEELTIRVDLAFTLVIW